MKCYILIHRYTYTAVPGEALLDVVQQTLGHQRVLVQVHQVRRLTHTTLFKHLTLTVGGFIDYIIIDMIYYI